MITRHPVLHNVFWQAGRGGKPRARLSSCKTSCFFLAHKNKMQNPAKASCGIDDIYIVMQFADLNIPLPCLDSPGQVLISLFGGHHAI